MSVRVEVCFELRSWWHTGSGRGVASSLDAVIVRDEDGLPFLPGRTVKGLLRDGVAQWEHWQSTVATVAGGGNVEAASLTTVLFGSRGGAEDLDRHSTVPGLLRVSSACVAAELRQALLADPARHALIEGMTSALRSTSIDGATGAAKLHSLRVIEVAMPLELHCCVEGPDAATLRERWPGATVDWVTVLGEAAGFVQGVGAGRHRGLGRVAVRVRAVGGAHG